MDTGKLREGGGAACLAVAFGLVWLVAGSDTDVGGYAALGAMLAFVIALWRTASGLIGSGTRD